MGPTFSSASLNTSCQTNFAHMKVHFYFNNAATELLFLTII